MPPELSERAPDIGDADGRVSADAYVAALPAPLRARVTVLAPGDDGAPRCVHAATPPTTAAHASEVGYEAAAAWSIDDEWLEALARFSCRFGAGGTVGIADLTPHRAAAETHAGAIGDAGLVVAFATTGIAPMLTAVRPSIIIDDGVAALAPPYVAALHTAAFVIALDPARAEAIRHLGVERVDVAEDADAAAARSADVLEDHASAAAFHSLRQKRWELRYEASYESDYDEQYHGGIVYREMDARLADLVGAQVKGLARPRLLDLGCGPGSMIDALRRIPGVEITGVDLSPEMIRRARLAHPDVSFEVGDAEVLPFEDGSFDAVLCSGVLHHLPDLDVTLSEIHRVLAPGGAFIAREPNNDHFAARHGELAFAHLCLRHHRFCAMGTAPAGEPGAHDYHREFAVDELVQELSGTFRVVDLVTRLRVTYFYEMIRDEAEFGPIRELEATLDGQPGLNLIVVGRKEHPGVDGAVEATLRTLAEVRPVPLRHYEQCATLIDDAARFALSPLDAVRAGRPTEAVRPEQRIAVVSGSWIAGWRRRRAIRRRGGVPTGFRLGLAGGPWDGVFVLAQSTFDLRGIVDALPALEPYGWLVLEVDANATMPGLDDPDVRAALGAVPLVAAGPMGHDVEGALIWPGLFTPTDADKALSVALAAAPDLADEPGAAALAKTLQARIERDLAAGAYSHLTAIESEATLLAWLDARAPRTSVAPPPAEGYGDEQL